VEAGSNTSTVTLRVVGGGSIENTASVVKKACLSVRYLAVDVFYCRVLYALSSNGLFSKNLSPRERVYGTDA
jgi:hypothetical protein